MGQGGVHLVEDRSSGERRQDSRVVYSRTTDGKAVVQVCRPPRSSNLCCGFTATSSLCKDSLSGVPNSSSRVHASCGHSSVSPFSNCLACPSCENYAVVPLFFLYFSLFIARPPVLSITLNCIIMPHDYYDNTWHVLMVKIPCIGYNS